MCALKSKLWLVSIRWSVDVRWMEQEELAVRSTELRRCSSLQRISSPRKGDLDSTDVIVRKQLPGAPAGLPTAGKTARDYSFASQSSARQAGCCAVPQLIHACVPWPVSPCVLSNHAPRTNTTDAAVVCRFLTCCTDRIVGVRERSGNMP